MKLDAGQFVAGLLGAFMSAAAIYVWTGREIEKRAEDRGRAADSQIQLEGPLPVEPASNALLSQEQNHYDQAIERCWKGVTYVIFPQGQASVGSVVLMPDGKPLPCSNN